MNNNDSAEKASGFTGWIPAVLILLAVAAIYGQSLWFGYVNYDDALILDKRWIAYRQLDWQGLWKIFLPHEMATYQPLRDLAFALVYRFSGTNPFGYHLFNVLLYLANLLAVFYLFRILLPYFTALDRKGATFWAGLAALWFAVHPVHVESVAWMVANKELLAGLFYFLSMICYVKSHREGFRTGFYLLSLIFLLLGLLSKPSVAALPLVLIAFELLGRKPDTRARDIILRSLPYLVLIAAAAGYYLFYTSAFVGRLLQGSLRIHLLTLSSVLAKYVLNLLLPVNLCNSYPPPFFSGSYNWHLAVFLGIDLLLAAALAFALRRKQKGLAFAILFFLLNLIPVSGIFPIAIFMADRYLYLSSFGFVLAGVLVLVRVFGTWSGPAAARRIFATAAAGALIFLTFLSAVRCRDWKDALTLWIAAVRTYPNYQYNYYGLANSYAQAGMQDQALETYLKTNMFKENFSADYYIARIYDVKGDSVEAEKYYRRVEALYEDEMLEQQWDVITAVYERLGLKDKLAGQLVENSRILKNYPERIMTIASKLASLGQVQKAVEALEGSIDAAPPSAGMRTALAAMLARLGDLAGALKAAQEARAKGENSVTLDLLEADLRFNSGDWRQAVGLYEAAGWEKLSARQKERLAASYFNSGRPGEALELFRALSREEGEKSAPAHNNIGVALEALDSLDEADKEYRKALELQENYADAWFNLGNVASKRGRNSEALEYYLRAEKIEGGTADLETARASLLAKMKRYPEALQLYGKLLEINPASKAALLGAGDAAWELGKKKIAREYYRKYLDRYGARAAPDGLLQRISGD
ncbi:MAG: hypothetical protein A2Z86_07835 [Candidatus Glassbacteria bacterium GWA2_58_10]|uniref:Glycosyltransferase RgtA/B/C/D-like domain-containing protein n=1 Tax=Candidatus Glassbacteria bacterium GWA2_58_10 TaxID=1817865 RepID=A0A1F5Y9C6_9BACT|nr:MAG: hypothetical protein A2Z86_07835 [Candidatus Glassbacteria bacterium GWA2_58_10]